MEIHVFPFLCTSGLILLQLVKLFSRSKVSGVGDVSLILINFLFTQSNISN